MTLIRDIRSDPLAWGGGIIKQVSTIRIKRGKMMMTGIRFFSPRGGSAKYPQHCQPAQEILLL